jgi:hypothetical protein
MAIRETGPQPPPITPRAIPKDPVRILCPHCLIPVLKVTIGIETITADLYEWEARAQCQSCLHTRRAHPTSHVSCGRCHDTGYVGTKRPTGRMLAIDVAWDDDLHLRLVGPRTDRRRGEALHSIHVCEADY